MAAIKFPPGTMWWRGGIGLPGFSSAPAEFSPLDLSPALWVDPSDAATVTISGSSGAYIGPNGLVLPASGTNYATSPDSGPLGITGDIDIIVKITPSDWTPTANSTLIAQWGASTAWVFSLLTTGHLRFTYTGNVTGSDLSTAATGVTDGSPKWVRVTLDADNGASGRDVKFWLSDDGASWTQLGSTVTTATAVTMTNSTSALEIGSYGGGVSELCRSATIHRAIVKNGIDGTTVFDADFENATPYVSAFTESALGAPVYVVSSTATSATASYSYIGPEGLMQSSVTGNIASTPSAAPLLMGSATEIDCIAKLTLPQWTGTTAQQCIITKGDTYVFRITTGGNLELVVFNGGYRGGPSTVATGLAAGSTKWVRATWRNTGATNEFLFYLSDDGVTWTQLGTTVTSAGVGSLTTNATDLRVGCYASGTQHIVNGTIHRAILKNGIDGTVVFDADFTAAPDYAASFTESSTNAATVTITATNTPANAAGALVSQIDDKSGNARHLTQGTAANMPKYWNGRNGLNCLVFDGSNDVLTGGDVLDLGTNSLTHYATGKLNSGANATVFGKYKVTPQSGMWLNFVQTPVSPRLHSSTYVDATTTAALSNSTVAIANNSWSLMGGIVDRAAGTHVARLNRADGTSTSFTPDSATNHNVTTHFWVGALRNSGDTGFQASYWWNGEIAEMFVAMSALGTTDRDSLEAHMRDKWSTV